MLNLVEFTKKADRDPELQTCLSAAQSAQAIIQIAQNSGFTITLSQLKQAAPELSATYWPWSGKGFRFRSQFFKG